MIELLPSNNFYINSPVLSRIEALFKFVYMGNIKALHKELKAGASPDMHDSQGNSLLSYALDYKQSTAAKLLVAHGARLNNVKTLGDTARDYIKAEETSLEQTLVALTIPSNASTYLASLEEAQEKVDAAGCCSCCPW